MEVRNLKRHIVAAGAALLTLTTVSLPSAAQSYPSRPISLVVPYGPGGNADLAARALANTMAKHPLLRGQPLVVENRTGAGGIAGTEYVRRAAPDGYTMLVARVGSQVVAPALDPVTPYKWDDLKAVGLLEVDPYVCVVRKDSPYKTFQELLGAIKARPGKLSYATSGNMDASVVFQLKAVLNLGLTAEAAVKVPYKSGGETVAPLLGGHVDFTCNGLAPYLGSLKSGEMRALVVSTAARVPELPDVPTVSEVGMKDLEMVSGWSALYGPPDLPDEVLKVWTQVLADAMKDPNWLEQVRRRATMPSIRSPEETRKFAGEQYEGYRSLATHLTKKK
jgi:tripartite-type tricarboxylate transporter receptor subunit TctC